MAHHVHRAEELATWVLINGSWYNIAPNLLERDFTADRPNQKWAGDISYIWTREGWLYLAVILDLHSRRVIGWAVSDRLKRDLAIRALKMAIALRSPPRGCIFHSDRGSQYCSHDYQRILRKHGLQSSMSGKGNCYDNVTAVWTPPCARAD
jgi:transposase InsO family protein